MFIRGIATATEAEIERPDPFADIYEDEKELEENKVVLEDSPLLSAILKLKNVCFVTSHEVLFTCTHATQIRVTASIRERPVFAQHIGRCSF